MPEFSMTEAEAVFTAYFNREAFSGESGPAFAWLVENEIHPTLMVAFQWAMEPKRSLRPHSAEISPSNSLAVPWPTAEAMRARVDEIIAAYPWLAAYTQPNATGLDSLDRDDGAVGQIPMYRLIRGASYVGRGRNGNIGLWDGECFLVIGEKFGRFVVKEEPNFVATWGCFQPFREIDEGQMTEPFGRIGWDAHYGRRMNFGPGEAPQGDA